MDDLTIIIHLRKDTDEREKNVKFAIDYYTEILPGVKFIIIEDDGVQHLNYLANYQNVKYYHFNNDSIYNKCKSYNLGLKHSDTDIVCFLDVDCIISEQNIQKAVLLSRKEKDTIYIGYNGVAVYLTYKAKQLIYSDVNKKQLYDVFNSYVDNHNIFNGYETDMYKIGNVKAVGGCLFGNRNVFEEINGFNPFFKGWGFEDNEIIKRSLKMGIPIKYINTKKPFFFHLPHENAHESESKIDTKGHDMQQSYIENYKEYTKVVSMTKEELYKYITKW